MQLQRQQVPGLIFSAIAVFAIIAVLLALYQFNIRRSNTPDGGEPNTTPEGDPISLTVNGRHVDDLPTDHTASPEELVGHISDIVIRANQTGNIQPFIDLVGQDKLQAKQLKHLQQLAQRSRLQLNQEKPFSAIEGSENDWALNLADKERILLKLRQNPHGNWQVDRVALSSPKSPPSTPQPTAPQPTPPVDPERALATASVQAFIDAIIALDPAKASTYVDRDQVSYASLAGLCILFEEGGYRPLQQEAIRNMFLGPTASGWIVRIQAPESEQNAMLAISLKRKTAQSPWLITEINLDKLLSDYAGRLSGGDIHYVPIIKNPQGGDSIALFFHLDSNTLTERTQRQLKIVAHLLKTSTKKKLNISGHTDALGSDPYNIKLSKQRALSVKQFLAKQGVAEQQMQITGFGKTQPRQPNTTDDGRRANRRAEIVLDF